VSNPDTEKYLLDKIKEKDAILNGISESLMLVDARTMEILEVNNSLLEDFKMAKEEVLGKTCHQIAHHSETPCSEKDIHCPVVATCLTGEVSTAEHVHLDRDCRPVYVEVTTYPLKDDSGAVNRVIHLSRNITDRKQAEESLRESEEKYRTLFEQSVDAIHLHDEKGNMIDVNRVAILQSGYTREEMLSLTVFDLHRDYSTRDEILRMWTEWPLGQRFTIEAKHRKKDGSLFPVEITTGRVRFGNRELILASVRDITDRKEAEEALRRSHEELELRVQERTAELERKNKELREFTFVAAHDLSEPLRKIQILGSYIEEKIKDCIDDKARHYVSRMARTAERMQKLLHAILTYSHLDMAGRQPEPFNLTDSVRKAVADTEPFIQKTGTQVEIGPLPGVIGDKEQLRQLFQNLVSNAVKYHRSDVRPLVRIHSAKSDENCRIFVEDNGIGFDEKYLDKIFRPFQCLHAKTEHEGLGIGLAICQKIVECHGGTITAKSTPGEGSTFIVTLPVSPANP